MTGSTLSTPPRSRTRARAAETWSRLTFPETREFGATRPPRPTRRASIARTAALPGSASAGAAATSSSTTATSARSSSATGRPRWTASPPQSEPAEQQPTTTKAMPELVDPAQPTTGERAGLAAQGEPPRPGGVDRRHPAPRVLRRSKQTRVVLFDVADSDPSPGRAAGRVIRSRGASLRRPCGPLVTTARHRYW